MRFQDKKINGPVLAVIATPSWAGYFFCITLMISRSNTDFPVPVKHDTSALKSHLTTQITKTGCKGIIARQANEMSRTGTTRVEDALALLNKV